MQMTRRGFIRLFALGFISAVAGELDASNADDDDDGI